MIKKRSFILLSVWVVIIGCFNVACSGEKHTSQLSWGKYYLWNAPDSAFQILRTIPSPEKLSKEEYSLYACFWFAASKQLVSVHSEDH